MKKLVLTICLIAFCFGVTSSAYGYRKEQWGSSLRPNRTACFTTVWYDDDGMSILYDCSSYKDTLFGGKKARNGMPFFLMYLQIIDIYTYNLEKWYVDGYTYCGLILEEYDIEKISIIKGILGKRLGIHENPVIYREDNSEKINSVQNQINETNESLSSWINWLKGQIEKLQTNIAELEESYSRQSEQYNENFEAINQNFQSTNEAISGIEKRLKKLEQVVDISLASNFEKVNLDDFFPKKYIIVEDTAKEVLSYKDDDFFSEINRNQAVGRVLAIRDFADVKKGELGGWIEGEHNLSHRGDCWIYPGATVIDKAIVSGSAKVSGRAVVQGDSEVTDSASVSGNANVMHAIVSGNSKVYGDAVVIKTEVCDVAEVCGKSRIYANLNENRLRICDDAKISGDVKIIPEYLRQDINLIGNGAVIETEKAAKSYLWDSYLKSLKD